MENYRKSASPEGTEVRCNWCGVYDSLNFVIPMKKRKKSFCSKECLMEFRREQTSGSCDNCEEVLSGPSVPLEISNHNKKFCSTECLIEYQRESTHRINRRKQKRKSSPIPIDISVSPTRKIQKVHKGEFTWSKYLKMTNSEPAPSKCFKQHAISLVNDFEEGMKMEAVDPRTNTSICIASVIGMIGPRMRLRLDGTDGGNDFFRLTDSGDLHKFGHSNRTLGATTQPPLGFQFQHDSWPEFLYKTLLNGVLAPKFAFKPEPPTPKANYFEAGMKLEAVDIKNPKFICVATVRAAKNKQVRIGFDGWGESFDYWCSYESRDLFPVGWCQQNGYPLQPPPGFNAPLARNQAFETGICSSTDKSELGDRYVPKDVSEVLTEKNSVCVYLHRSCNCGVYLKKTRTGSLHNNQIGPGSFNFVLDQLYHTLLYTAVEPKMIEKFIKYGLERRIRITSRKTDGVRELFFSQLNDVEQFWTFVEALRKHLGCCENFYSRYPVESCYICDSDIMFIAEVSKPHGDPECDSSVTDSPPDKWRCCTVVPEIESVVQEVSSTVQGALVIQGTSTSIPKPTLAVQRVPQSVQVVPTSMQVTTSSNDTGLHATNPRSWSVEDAIEKLCNAIPDFKLNADIFREHEIDGVALLLLCEETMTKDMKMKLGPALKINNFIKKIKQRWRSSNGI